MLFDDATDCALLGLALSCGLHLQGCGGGGTPSPTPAPTLVPLCPISTNFSTEIKPIPEFPVVPLSWEAARKQAEALVQSMGLCDKHLLMQGVGWQNFSGMKTGYYVGTTYGNPDLGIPSLNMNDAAGGFRTYWEGEVGTVTAWPSLLSVAATWDSDRVEEFGEALGEGFVGKGANAILGPSVNVHRVARGGRNFEYMSGEDPYLGSKLTTAYMKGVQSRGVMTTVKH